MPWATWKPSTVQRVERVLATSMNTVVVVTDAGKGYLKALGNAQGEHALACELIGSSLAEWFGLPTLEFTLVSIDATRDDVILEDDENIPVNSRRRASSGPAFVTKAVESTSWNGDPTALAELKNPEAIAGLVLLDTWIGNPDRHPRRPPDTSLSTWTKSNLDNVMLAHGSGKKPRRRIVAMDFSVCLYCRSGGLRPTYDDRLVRDDGIYGLFSAFEPFVTPERLRPFLARLGQARELQQHLVDTMSRVPTEWHVDGRTATAVQEFLSARAAYLADNFCTNLQRIVTDLPG